MTQGANLLAALRWRALVAVAVIVIGATGIMVASADQGSTNPLLISTGRLEELLDDPNTRIVDIRDDLAFDAGHIPNAVSYPASHALDPSSRIPGARHSDNRLSRVFATLGIGKDTFLVIYDDKGGHEAARILWIAQYMGHQSVSVLDGGFPKWQREDRPISNDVQQVRIQDLILS